MNLNEDFFDEMNNPVDVENAVTDGTYEMQLSFSTSLGSRNIRLFVAHIPFENMFRNFMQIMKSCSFMTTDDFVNTIIVSNKEKTYTQDFGVNFKKGVISEYITTHSDVFFHRMGVNATVTVTSVYKVKFVYESVSKREYAKDCCNILNVISTIESNMKLLSKYQDSPSITIKPVLLKDGNSFVEYDEYLGSGNMDYWKKFFASVYKEIESDADETMIYSMISSGMNTKKYENAKVSDIDFLKKWMSVIVEKANKNRLFEGKLFSYNRLFTKKMNALSGCQVVLLDSCGHSIKEIGEGVLGIMESSLMWMTELKLTEYGSVDHKTIFVCISTNEEVGDEPTDFRKTVTIVDSGNFSTTLTIVVTITDSHLNVKTQQGMRTEIYKNCLRDAEIA